VKFPYSDRPGELLPTLQEIIFDDERAQGVQEYLNSMGCDENKNLRRLLEEEMKARTWPSGIVAAARQQQRSPA